jgi:hypothetical protein
LDCLTSVDDVMRLLVGNVADDERENSSPPRHGRRTIGFDPATGSAEAGKHGDRMH